MPQCYNYKSAQYEVEPITKNRYETPWWADEVKL